MWGRIIIGVVIAAGISLGLYFGLKDRCDPIPEGQVLINENVLDSLRKVASLPPDTVWNTEVVVEEVPKYIIRNKPVPYFVDLPNGERQYIDSVKMVEDGINAWVKVTAQGVVDQIMWGYTPVYKTITREINKPEPYPVDVEIEIPQRGLFLQGGVGAGPGTAGFSLGAMWQQRNGLTYGAEILQFDKRYYMVKVGYKIL